MRGILDRFQRMRVNEKNEVPKNVLRPNLPSWDEIASWDDFLEISPSQLGRHDCMPGGIFV